MHIGIDVGGTNTDAVLMNGARVIAEIKRATSGDVTEGVVSALAGLAEVAAFDPAGIRAVMIGTTHFTNAIVEGRNLAPTAAVRLGLPATEALPPMVDWPPRLREILGDHVYLCHGGHEFDGRIISPLDESELRQVADEIGRIGVKTVAISSVFSPVNAEFELQAADLLANELPGVHVSLSHEIGRIGLLERENATIVNACLRDLADRIADAFGNALARAKIAAPLYLSQNDGTLMDVEYARRYPVATFASGPTNSMRGAAFLSGVTDGAVVDIGGTTTDVGVLARGFPREAATEVRIGGVRTNFRMPDVLSIGIGGGSRVRLDGGVAVGPDSVGYQLSREALVFGGATLTATDLAVAGGRAKVGDPGAVAGLDRETVRAALAHLDQRISEVVDRMRTSPAALPVVVVGGGSVLLSDRLPGFDKLHRPEHFAVANAIGAAIAQVGGEVDRIFAIGAASREQILDEAKAEAVAKAVAAGAREQDVEIVEVDEVPIAYLPGNAVRLRVKAVGDLALMADHDREGSNPAGQLHA
jgi:N-methylhydantoinase A/oxoprolinase/acetone carboxylase beta subunit